MWVREGEDKTYTLRDVYYPHVGQENHTNGHLNRFGVWVDGHLSWLNDSGWQRSLRYESRTLVTDVTLTSDSLNLQLTFTDAVDLEHVVGDRVGDLVDVRTPAGIEQVEVLGIEYPET